MNRILIVDDDDAIREFISLALKDQGYQSIEAIDGLSALDIIQTTPVQLIILDMKMPLMDGWSFLKIYEHFPAPHAPVIAISANTETSNIVTDDVVRFLDKPFDLEVLYREIELCISARPSAYTH